MAKKRPPPLVPVTFHSLLTLILDVVWIPLLIIPAIVISIIKNIFFRPMKDIKGKVTLVTGAGNGLGKEMALQLGKQGCIVICVDVREEDNRKTLDEILKAKGTGRAYRCDVSSPEETKALAEVVLDEFGRVDIVINNAGLVFGNGILTGTVEEVTKVVGVNFLSNIWMVRAFLPDMISKKEGHLVFIGSASGIHSLAQGNIYSSTKFAILGMVSSLMEELRGATATKDIKVSCALPYFVDTNRKYSDSWNLRLPALTTEKAATLVIEGVRREYKLFTVPWVAFGYNITLLYRALPQRFYEYIRDRFYTDFTVGSTLETKL